MIWIVIAGSVLIITVFLLPLLSKALLNKKLSAAEGFKGHVERIRLRLIAGKIILYNSSFTGTEHAEQKSLLQVPVITISFSWKSLLRKILDVNILIDSPELFIVVEQKSSSAQALTASSNAIPSLKNAVERIMPFRLNTEVRNGKIQLVASGSTEKLELIMTATNLTVADLSNQKEHTGFCLIRCRGNLYEGNLEMNISLRPLEPTLTLDLNLELKSINLVLLNNLLRTYGKVDINQGTLHLSAEIAVSNNLFKGYVKPILKDLDFVGTADRGDSVFQKIWERTVAVFVQLLENNRKNQIATKIPIEGRLDEPHVQVAAAVIGVIKNAFVKALSPSLEDIINIDSIWKKTKLRTNGIFKSMFKNRKSV